MLAGLKYLKMAGKTSSVPIHKKRRYREQQETHIGNILLVLVLVVITRQNETGKFYENRTHVSNTNGNKTETVAG